MLSKKVDQSFNVEPLSLQEELLLAQLVIMVQTAGG